MVDVGDKAVVRRTAVAGGLIRMSPETVALLKDAALPKGDVLSTARVAGVMAAKKTPELIPLCDGPRERPDGRRDGGPDRRERGRPDRLRYVQGRRQRHGDR